MVANKEIDIIVCTGTGSFNNLFHLPTVKFLHYLWVSLRLDNNEIVSVLQEIIKYYGIWTVKESNQHPWF